MDGKKGERKKSLSEFLQVLLLLFPFRLIIGTILSFTLKLLPL